MKASRLQIILSYLFPVKIWNGSSSQNPELELFIANGDWQLATRDAIYSDGRKYRPLVSAFRMLRKELNTVKSVLFLGSGIGSGVQILNNLGFYPACTLVDNDETILQLAAKLLPSPEDIRFVCQDADVFVRHDNTIFDMIVVDVFTGRSVPQFVSTHEFIQHCCQHLAPHGILVINFMLNTEEDKKRFSRLKQWLPEHVRIIDIGINRVIVAIV